MSVEVELSHRLGEFNLDVSFSFSSGEVTALFGPSGAGKSTVINIIAGLSQPNKGLVRINDRVLTDTEKGVFIAPKRRRIGYVFQQSRLFPHLSVERNLRFGWQRAKTKPSESEVANLVSLLGISHLLKRKPDALSGGEKQRVALGRALLSNPELLLLDEPLAALDHKRRDEILPYLERIRHEQKIPLLYVSHSIDEVTRLAEKIHILNSGSIIASGSVADVFSRIDLYPITGRFEAGAIIDGSISAHDTQYQLSHISFDGQLLTVPKIQGEIDDPVRVRVRARDIIITLERPKEISANNVLEGVITEIRVDDGAYADLQILCGRARLIARITRHSADRLNLKVNSSVFALIKSVTIDRRSLR